MTVTSAAAARSALAASSPPKPAPAITTLGRSCGMRLSPVLRHPVYAILDVMWPRDAASTSCAYLSSGHTRAIAGLGSFPGEPRKVSLLRLHALADAERAVQPLDQGRPCGRA